VLLQVIGVGRAGPVNQVKIDVVNTQVLEGGVNALLNTVVPGVVKLGSEPDLLAGDARVTNTSANLGLVSVGQGSVNVTVALQQGVLNSLADLVGLRLPGTKTDGGNLIAGVKSVGLLSVVRHCGGSSRRMKKEE